MKWKLTRQNKWVVALTVLSEDFAIVLHQIGGVWHLNCASLGIILRPLDKDAESAKKLAIQFLLSYLTTISKELGKINEAAV